MKVMKFSHNYSKLQNDTFTTIRRYDRYSVGSQITVKTPKTTFKAIIIHKIKVKLENIPTGLLILDTDKNTRQEAVELLNSFYKKPITTDEKVTIYYLSRIKGDSK